MIEAARRVVRARRPGASCATCRTTILRGDRIGLIGPNGSGKTTLLKLLLGELQPQTGRGASSARSCRSRISTSTARTLREDWNAIENVAEGRDFIEIGGRRKHVLGYLQDFLFTPERARAPITRLSGGERNRLLLARLFAQPSNLLVMDEPTNDLDVETLELLEELLAEYAGTLLLVSHDRDFLDNVVTSTLVMRRRRPRRRIRRRLQRLAAAAARGVCDRGHRGRGQQAGCPGCGHAVPAARQAQAQLQGRARTRAAAGADRGAGNRARRR